MYNSLSFPCDSFTTSLPYSNNIVPLKGESLSRYNTGIKLAKFFLFYIGKKIVKSIKNKLKMVVLLFTHQTYIFISGYGDVVR